MNRKISTMSLLIIVVTILTLIYPFKNIYKTIILYEL